MTGTLVAVCVVRQIHLVPSIGKETAIDKRPVDGPVAVDAGGVDGDTRRDQKNHGGPDHALYAYAREEAARWAGELGRRIPAGGFGENLAITGMRVTDAVIGERWLIGDRETGVIAEVTGPRTPCQRFQFWMGEQQWVKRFTARGDTGAYLRVLRAGVVKAGDQIEVTARPEHGVTVRDLFTARDQDPAHLRRLLDDESITLSEDAVVMLDRVLQTSQK